jgi:membrane protease YdiL (CAAX protease family)
MNKIAQVALLTDSGESLIKRQIITYVLLALALAWGFDFAALALGVDFNQLDASPPVIWLLLIGASWAPAMAAIVTRLLYGQGLKGMGWGRFQFRFLLLAILLPLLYISLSYTATWLLDSGSFAPYLALPAATEMLGTGWASDGMIVFCYLLLNAMLLILPIGFFALGEEMGWAGLLVPQLSRLTSFGTTAIVTGLIWAMFHYPFMLFANYTQGAPLWYGITVNTLVMIALAFGQAWLRLRSGTIWPVVLTHALWNILMFYVFEPITQVTPLTTYLVGEKGAMTALLVLAFAWLFWQLSRSAQAQTNFK